MSDVDPEMSPEDPCEKCKSGWHNQCLKFRYVAANMQSCCCNTLVRSAPVIDIGEFDDSPLEPEPPEPDEITTDVLDGLEKLE